MESEVPIGGCMRNQVPQLIIMLSGAALITVGIMLVIMQFAHEMQLPQYMPSTRGLEFGPAEGIKLSTTYVGLILVGIGAFLEVVGFGATIPWKQSDRSN